MKRCSGFSVIELLIALLIVLVAGMMTVQLFRENERVIRDQNLIMEMQQTARVVISQIADEVRMAGQSVPVFATTFDASPSEATAVFLGTSASDRIDFRAGLSNVETVVTTAAPIDVSVGHFPYGRKRMAAAFLEVYLSIGLLSLIDQQ